MGEDLFANRWNLGAMLVAGIALAVGHVLVPNRSTRYGSYLVVFTMWMIWFVFTGVQLIEHLER